MLFAATLALLGAGATACTDAPSDRTTGSALQRVRCTAIPDTFAETFGGPAYGGDTYGCDDPVPVCVADDTGAVDCADPACADAPACAPDGECPLGPDGDPDCADPDCAQAANCIADGECGEDADGSSDCDDPDCAEAPSCTPDGTCGETADGRADCDDPDCVDGPACDLLCEEADDGTVDCADPDCTGEPQCGSDGECRVDEEGGSDCDDPDCAEEADCTGDGVCEETVAGEPDCEDVDCADENECESDDVCEEDVSGEIDCDDPDCGGQPACAGDGVCGTIPGDPLDVDTIGGALFKTGPRSVPQTDCADPDCAEAPACAPPEPPTKRITFPELLAVQHIRTFNVGAYVDEILAVDPWLSVVAAGGAGAIEYVVVLGRMIKGLQMTANPEVPWHLLSNGNELINGVWRPGLPIATFWASKEYRSWLKMTASTGGWWPQIKCKDGQLLAAYAGSKLNGAVSHSHGWTPDPLHFIYTAGEPKTGSPWHSYTVNAANTALTWNARLESRISRPARVVSFGILGYDAPFIYSKLKYTLRCDGSYSVEAEASKFPTVTLYMNRRAHAWRGQRGIAAFLKSGSAGALDPNGAGPTAPGAVYTSFNGQGDIVDE